MGIVVCITMLLGLLMFFPKPWQVNQQTAGNKSVISRQSLVAVLLIIIGVWNAFWYGAQHLELFWGKAAMASGIIMLLTAIVLSVESGDESSAVFNSVYRLIKPIRLLIIVGLLACFLLYAVTLVQLNLGYPILV